LRKQRGKSPSAAVPPVPDAPSQAVRHTHLRAQGPPQELFLSSPADITIYGGAAGGGKSWGLLIDAARYVDNVPGYNAVIFRRTHTEIRNPGGLWDESQKLYRGPKLFGKANETRLEWTFPPYGNTITFAHMQHEHDRFRYQGSQIPVIGFDELTTFTRAQFFYMLSRNRSLCGITPYIRGTCNPDADSWVAELVAWWINEQTGLPRPERTGRIRWFRQEEHEDKLVWADTRDALVDPADPENKPLSLTFIPANIFDNIELMKRDPDYLNKLRQMPRVERERLLSGNWKIRPSAGQIFDRGWFDIWDDLPWNDQVVARARYWDKAGTPGSTSYTVGARLAVLESGRFVVEHVERGQWLAPDRNRVMLQTAKADGRHVFIYTEQEPGSGGKESAELSVAELNRAGFVAEAKPVTGDKIARASMMSAHAERRNIVLLRGDWNEKYLAELYGFPDSVHDDQVDASSGAFNRLSALYNEIKEHEFLPEEADTELRGDLPVREIGDTNFIEDELFR
jgi:predicted phage terminase large subunit-like protein